MRAFRLYVVMAAGIGTEALLTLVIGFANVAVSAIALWAKLRRKDDNDDPDDAE